MSVSKYLNKLIFLVLECFLVSMLFTSCFKGKNNEDKDQAKSCAMVMEQTGNSRSVTDEMAESVFSQIEEVLSQRDDLRIIDRTKFESVKKEQAWQQTDWSDKEKTAEIGKALNADLICFVTVYNDKYKVEFLNVNTVQKRVHIGEISTGLISKKQKVEDLDKLKKLKISDL